MSDVKWIKITTDMFDNRKIKHLRKLPDGNNIVLIWVMLLTMAGRCNSGGMIFLTENIPYTSKMLADELDFEENTVKLALDALEQLNMIRTDGFLSIAGWEEYQNIEGMDKIREQNRLRQKAWYERHKALPNVISNAILTQPNATEIDIDIDKELDIEIENDKRKKFERKRFVAPTLEEVQAYCQERKNNIDAEHFIDYYQVRGWELSKGRKMKDWKAAVRTWERNGFSRKKVGANGVRITDAQDDILDGIL